MTRTTETEVTAEARLLTYEAIPAEELDAIRAAGRDEAGNPLEVRVHEEGGAPLRCCLREARPGERLLLIAYMPPGTAGAYAERGPVFIHADRCEGYLTPHVYPTGCSSVASRWSGPTTGRAGSPTGCWSPTATRPRASSRNSCPGPRLSWYTCATSATAATTLLSGLSARTATSGPHDGSVAAENLASRGHPALRASRAGVHPGADRGRRDRVGVHRAVRVLGAVPVSAGRRAGRAAGGAAAGVLRRGHLPGGRRHLAAHLAGPDRAGLGRRARWSRSTGCPTTARAGACAPPTGTS